MTRFAEVLEGVRERVDLPQPARTRFLLEIAADLEDLAARLADTGFGIDHTPEGHVLVRDPAGNPLRFSIGPG